MDYRNTNILFSFCLLFLFAMNINAQSESANVPKDWQTLAEQTDYHKSWNYADTIAFAEKISKSVAANRIQIFRQIRRRQRFAAFDCLER